MSTIILFTAKSDTTVQLVDSFKYRTNVKTVIFTIDVKSTTKIADAKKISDKIINNLPNDVIEFYDISIYLVQSSGNSKEYPAIGYSSKGSKEFNWTINKEVTK